MVRFLPALINITSAAAYATVTADEVVKRWEANETRLHVKACCST